MPDDEPRKPDDRERVEDGRSPGEERRKPRSSFVDRIGKARGRRVEDRDPPPAPPRSDS